MFIVSTTESSGFAIDLSLVRAVVPTKLGGKYQVILALGICLTVSQEHGESLIKELAELAESEG